MQIYLVGGAVRDELLGRPVGERDWVVVGATPEEMQRRGYRAVGREFPVYLHPETHEEYALARRERKVGPGYRGFTTQFSPQVSLEEDLQRRDLTINAIARAPDGQLIDPFGGQRDLERRLLRHVSAAFVEDPVRILRVARFAARFAELGFTVVPETRQLMRQIVDAGEVRAVVPERLWRELERALQEPHPEAAFDTLQECGALPVLLPELAWGEHQRCVLQAAVSVSLDAAVRFAALLAAGTPIAAIESLADRLRIPNHYRELAVLAARWSGEIGKAQHLDAHGLLQLLEGADAFRRGERFQALLAAAQAVQIGQRGAAAATTTHARATASSQLLAAVLAAATAVSLPAEQLAALKGTAIAAALHAAREQRIETLLCERPG